MFSLSLPSVVCRSAHYSEICIYYEKKNLENAKGAINNGQSRENGNMGYLKRRRTKQTHNKNNVKWLSPNTYDHP
jgi:hypothetical protein